MGKIIAMCKLLGFGLMFSLGFLSLQGWVASGTGSENYEHVNAAIREPKDSLDVVIIGSSNTYAYYEPPIMFETTGLSVGLFAASNLSPVAVKPIIQELRKSQPDALYLVCLSTPRDKFLREHFHSTVDFLPYGPMKLRIIKTVCDWYDLPLEERMEYYFPIIRFHERWKNLSYEDFHYEDPGYKGSCHHVGFRKRIMDCSEGIIEDFESVKQPKQGYLDIIQDLCRFAKEEDVNLAFLYSPQVLQEKPKKNLKKVRQMNALRDMLREDGFEVFDLRALREEIGLDPSTDYYNAKHTNVYGAMKVSQYTARLLSEKYGFTDKRGDERYTSFHQAYVDYCEDVVLPKVSEDKLPAKIDDVKALLAGEG